MSDYAVLTAIGEDRPGLVDAVSSFILHSGCNIEDSRMAILGGEFAMLILLSGDRAAVERVKTGVADTGSKVGLSISVRPTRSGAERPRQGTLPYELEAFSMDHPGIVQKVAHFLAEEKINIRALETRVRAAPHSGEPVFSLHALLDIPSNANLSDVRKGLELIGAAENIDLELKAAG